MADIDGCLANSNFPLSPLQTESSFVLDNKVTSSGLIQSCKSPSPFSDTSQASLSRWPHERVMGAGREDM